MGYTPSKLKFHAKAWKDIESEEDKQLLNDFICKRMKKYCSFSKKSSREPSSVTQSLTQAVFTLSELGRVFLSENEDKIEDDIPKELKKCYMGHSSVFAIKASAFGSPEEYLAPVGNSKLALSKEILEERKREWEWKTFHFCDDKSIEQFDIFAFLGNLQQYVIHHPFHFMDDF